MSEQFKSIGEKLVSLMKEVGYTQKDKANKDQHYRYVSAEAIMKKVQAGMVKHNLIYGEKVKILNDVEITFRSGGKSRLVTVEVTGTVTDPETGVAFASQGLGSGTDYGDKAVMKALTAARKYFWVGLLCIATGDDPEADPSGDDIAGESQEVTFDPENENQEPKPTPANLSEAIDAVKSLDALKRVYEEYKELWTARGLGTEFNRLIAKRKKELQKEVEDAR